MERMWLFHEDIELFHRAPLSLPRPHARARSRHLRFGHLGAPQRRSLGRSTTSVQHAADCSRESSVLKLAGPYMYMYTPTVLHVPVPECVPCVSTRVNVNTTDATTGATALLLPAPCVSRVCPGSPGVFLNTRNYSVTTEHVV